MSTKGGTPTIPEMVIFNREEPLFGNSHGQTPVAKWLTCIMLAVSWGIGKQCTLSPLCSRFCCSLGGGSCYCCHRSHAHAILRVSLPICFFRMMLYILALARIGGGFSGANFLPSLSQQMHGWFSENRGTPILIVFRNKPSIMVGISFISGE